MCVPCVAPAAPLLPEILLFLLAGVGMIALYFFRALPYVGMLLWRFLTGARILKDLGAREADLPARRFARHVHATLRVSAVIAALLSMAFPIFALTMATVLPATAIAGGIEKGRRVFEARQERLRLEGQPIKARARVTSRG